jgi:hypothetical protein
MNICTFGFDLTREGFSRILELCPNRTLPLRDGIRPVVFLFHGCCTLGSSSEWIFRMGTFWGPGYVISRR